MANLRNYSTNFVINFPLVTSLIFALLLSLSSCTSVNNKPEENPLKNTKKLVKEGHVSLYENGAINVPNTRIMLIPAGPSAMEFALELSGTKARESFLLSLKNAQDAVYLVADGTRKSFSIAGDIVDESDKVANYITSNSRKNSKLLVYRAYPTTRHIIGETFQFSDKASNELKTAAISLREESNSLAKDAISRQKSYADFASASIAFSTSAVTHSASDVKKDFENIRNKFIKGYIALPKKWASNTNKKNSGSPFKENWKKSLEVRENLSNHFTDILADTGTQYSDDISASINKSKNALSSASDTGVGLAALDSVRWLLKALLWDATIKPISKLGYASVGYVTSNTVIFPVMVVAGEGVAVTQVAVEVAINSSRKTIDVVAPTFEAALASTYAISSFAVKSAGGITLGTTGVAGSVAIGVTDSLSALTIQTAGNISGYGIEYIGVPLVTAGVKVAGTTSGVVVGSAKAVAGSTLFIGGETSAAVTKTVGYTGAGGVAAAGTVLSGVGGTSIGVYELTKAVAVPASYELGGGIVLGYSSMSHIAAHTILAAADASYLVLSLEGPRWVVYAVKGNLGNGEHLTPGTVLNLNEMRTAGEEFSVLAASQEELEILVHEAQDDFPFE